MSYYAVQDVVDHLISASGGGVQGAEQRELRADVLTEVGEGGLLQGVWEAADKAVLLPAVEVIPWSEAVALLPVEAN